MVLYTKNVRVVNVYHSMWFISANNFVFCPLQTASFVKFKLAYSKNKINVNGLCHEILRTVYKGNMNKCSAVKIISCGLSNQILYFMFCLEKVFSNRNVVLSNQIFFYTYVCTRPEHCPIKSFYF